MISFRCLMCSKTVTADDSAHEETMDCPDCGASLKVPEQSVETPTPVIDKATSQSKTHLADHEEEGVSSGTKSIFRAKRKAQTEAESSGKEFDSSRFDQDKLPRRVVLGMLSALVLAVGIYSVYVMQPVKRLEFTDEQANALLQGMNTKDDSSVASLMDAYLNAQCTCTEMMAEILRYIDSEEKLEEVLGDLKRLSQIAMIRNPLIDAIDRNSPNMEMYPLMGEHQGRQIGAHRKMQVEVLRIQRIDATMADRLRDEVQAISKLQMFQG